MSSSPDFGASTDNELLMQFLRHRDEEAFRQLVERHAALLMSVCRHVTRNEQDAEDAFQATLLILVRRADRLLHVTSLSGWLHRVAFRTALRAGGKPTTQRESRLVKEPVIEEEDALRCIHTREIQRVLHEELRQIAPRYRNAIVLCDLEGKTRLEAAEQLDCTEAAVKAALARGRRCLRFRMLKRGALLTVGLITANKAIAATPVSPALIQKAVVLSFRQISTSEALDLSDPVQKLAREGVRAMTYSSLVKPLALIPIAVVLVALPLALLGQIPGERSVDTKILISQSPNDPATRTTLFLAADPPNLSDSNDSETQDETDPNNNGIDDLTSELLSTLRQLVSDTEQQYRAGTEHLDAVLRARGKLLQVQLDLADSRPERVRVLQEQVENFRALERYVEELHKVGKATSTQLLAAKAERLETQITLLKARAD